jgi:hypothetical protein
LLCWNDKINILKICNQKKIEKKIDFVRKKKKIPAERKLCENLLHLVVDSFSKNKKKIHKKHTDEADIQLDKYLILHKTAHGFGNK